MCKNLIYFLFVLALSRVGQSWLSDSSRIEQGEQLRQDWGTFIQCFMFANTEDQPKKYGSLSYVCVSYLYYLLLLIHSLLSPWTNIIMDFSLRAQWKLSMGPAILSKECAVAHPMLYCHITKEQFVFDTPGTWKQTSIVNHTEL